MTQGADEGGCVAVFVLIAVSWFIFYGADSEYGDRAWYALRYLVWPSQVTRDARPIDCDFFHAPLGLKDCKYRLIVKAYDKESYLVAGDDAPRYARDAKTGHPITSYDEGKTWQMIGLATLPSMIVASVHLSWKREAR